MGRQVRALKHLALDEAETAALAENVGGASRLASALFKIGTAMGESSEITGETTPMGTISIEEATRKIAELRSSDAYLKRTDPGHAAAVREMRSLQLIVHPRDGDPGVKVLGAGQGEPEVI
jgi:hypothetical protein